MIKHNPRTIDAVLPPNRAQYDRQTNPEKLRASLGRAVTKGSNQTGVDALRTAMQALYIAECLDARTAPERPKQAFIRRPKGAWWEVDVVSEGELIDQCDKPTLMRANDWIEREHPGSVRIAG